MIPTQHIEPPLRDPLSATIIDLSKAAIASIDAAWNFNYAVAAQVQGFVAATSPRERPALCWRMRDVCSGFALSTEIGHLLNEKFGSDEPGESPQNWDRKFEIAWIDCALAETAANFAERLSATTPSFPSSGFEALATELESELQVTLQKVFCVKDKPYREPPARRERFTQDMLKANDGTFYAHDFELYARHDGGQLSATGLENLFNLHNRIVLHMHLATALASIAATPIESDVADFGAKGTNLERLDTVIRLLGPVLERVGISAMVPEFRRVKTDVYDRFVSTGGIENSSIDGIVSWMNGLPKEHFMVRSSAVLSEDGEKLGAGVYRTVKIAGTASRSEFEAAIRAVYESVDTEDAIAYRRNQGIAETEKMGLIVQRAARNRFREDESTSPGYINTVRYGIPDAIAVVFQDRFVPEFGSGADREIVDGRATVGVLSRRELWERLGLRDLSLSAGFIVAPDVGGSQVNPSDMQQLATAGLVIELAFGRPLQLEFVKAGWEINFVQARPLPPKWIAASTITFPEHATAISGAKGIGILDAVLPILGDDVKNCQREGLVILSGSYMSSNHRGWIDKIVPKSGAVLLLTPSESMNGHVESRCLERGVVILTHWVPKTSSGARPDGFAALSDFVGRDVSQWLVYRDKLKPGVLIPDKPVNARVVCNGLEGRLYRPEQFDE